jgi:exonuclease VII small subunit
MTSKKSNPEIEGDNESTVVQELNKLEMMFEEVIAGWQKENCSREAIGALQFASGAVRDVLARLSRQSEGQKRKNPDV